MKIGKIPEQVLVRSVLNKIKHRRDEVVKGPGVGQDCAALAIAQDEILVLSSDPITGTVDQIGTVGAHIVANDLAASGSEPIGLMVTLLLPERTREIQIKKIMEELEETCIQLSMEILGGHTEITNVVNQPVITLTGVGKIKKGLFIDNEKLTKGLELVITKWIGIEGTVILAKEKETELKKRLSSPLVETAKNFYQYLSVVPESKVAMNHQVVAMHDITEGGVFGALWELAEAGKVGLEVDLRKIPVRQETIEICEQLGINPYYLIGSGSMLIATKDGQGLVNALQEEGIPGTIVGRTTDGNDRILRNLQEVRHLERPQPDELYKARGSVKGV